MSIRVNIPEADALRRLAASLATALSSTGRFEGRIDFDLSAGVFFRRFPWTGVFYKPELLPEFDSSTTGQYFAAFNWEGHPVQPDPLITPLPAKGGPASPGPANALPGELWDSLFGKDD